MLKRTVVSLMQLSLRILLVLLCGLVASDRFARGEPVAAPGGPPPYPARVILQGDQLLQQRLGFRLVEEKRQREVVVNGKKEMQAYTVVTNVPAYWVQAMPKDAFRAITVGGKRLSDEEAAAALAKETDVLVSSAAKLLDRRCRALFKPETIVVYVKPEQMIHGPPPEPQPPEFSTTEAPAGTPPDIGFLRKVGEELVLTEFDWEPVNEHKLISLEVKAPDGTLKTMHKTVVQIHWVPEPREQKIKLGQFATLDLTGQQTHGAFEELTDQPVAVLLHDAKHQFVAAHVRHCHPDAVVLRGDFPPPDLYATYSAPAPTPPSEYFASVQGNALIVRRAVWEVHGSPAFGLLEQPPKSFVAHWNEDRQTPVGHEIKTKFVAEKVPLDKVNAVDAAGKAIDSAALAGRLAKESPVLVAASDEPVDPLYLATLKPDTIVLTLPLEQGPPPGSIPAPAPVPLRDPPPGPMPGKAPQPKPVPQTGLPTRGSGAFFVAAQAPASRVPPHAVEPSPPASGPPPRLVKIQAFGDKLVLRNPITIAGFAPMTELPKEGEPERGKFQVFTHWESRVISADNFRLYDLNGQPLDAAATSQRLAQPTIALLSDAGKKVDSAWLSIYQPETVLVYIKPEAMEGGYGHGMMAPPPAAPLPPGAAEPPPEGAPTPAAPPSAEPIKSLPPRLPPAKGPSQAPKAAPGPRVVS